MIESVGQAPSYVLHWKGTEMHVITWAHLLYVGLWSVIVILSWFIGLVRGIAFSITATGIHAVLHIAVGSAGIAAVFLAARGKRAFPWLLMLWWLPQLVRVCGAFFVLIDFSTT